MILNLIMLTHLWWGWLKFHDLCEGWQSLLERLNAKSQIFEEGRSDTVLNSCIIFEVLSKSTSSRDRGDKFSYYRSISEFQEYILIDQYVTHIEQFSKNSDGNWLFRESDAQDGILTLFSVNCKIPHHQIHERVKFE